MSHLHLGESPLIEERERLFTMYEQAVADVAEGEALKLSEPERVATETRAYAEGKRKQKPKPSRALEGQKQIDGALMVLEDVRNLIERNDAALLGEAVERADELLPEFNDAENRAQGIVAKLINEQLEPLLLAFLAARAERIAFEQAIGQGNAGRPYLVEPSPEVPGVLGDVMNQLAEFVALPTLAPVTATRPTSLDEITGGGSPDYGVEYNPATGRSEVRQ